MKKSKIIYLKETQQFLTNRVLLLLGFHITIGIFIVSNHHSILETSLNGIVSNPELTIFMLFFGLVGSGLWIHSLIKMILILNAEERIKLKKSEDYYKKHKMNISKMYKRYEYCRTYFLFIIILLVLTTLITLRIPS